MLISYPTDYLLAKHAKRDMRYRIRVSAKETCDDHLPKPAFDTAKGLERKSTVAFRLIGEENNQTPLNRS